MNKLRLLFIGFLLSGCGATSTSYKFSGETIKYGECGQLYGSFIGDWFDYYKRGITYMDCGKWIEAEHDFKKALNVRSVDKRRVYTLGMHFLTNYFPNRELGIALYNQAKYDEAQKHLELSYQQFPTAKARTFLVRSISQNVTLQSKDSFKPKIEILAESKTQLKLSIKDDSYIESIRTNDQEVLLQQTKTIDDVSIGYEPLTKSLDLTLDKQEYGDLKVDLVVKDVFGKTSTLTITPEDKTPVQMHLVGQSEINGQTFYGIKLFDVSSGIKSIKINDKLLSQADINAMKAAGEINTTSCPNSQNSACKYSLKPTQGYMFQTAQLNLPATLGKFEITAIDVAGNTKTTNFLVEQLVNQNEISIYSDKLETVTQENQTLFELEIASNEPIKQIRINDKTHQVERAKLVNLSQLVPLSMGNNQIKVEVTDSVKTYRKNFNVQRVLPPNFPLEERLTMAILPFDCGNLKTPDCINQQPNFAQYFELFEQRKRFQLSSRNMLETALIESQYCDLASSEACIAHLTDKFNTQAKQIYKTQQDVLFGQASQVLLSARVTRRPLNAGQLDAADVEIKVIQSNSGRALLSLSFYEEIKPNTRLSLEKIANKVHAYFPLMNFTLAEQKLESTQGQFTPWNNMPVLGKEDDVCYVGLIKARARSEQLGQTDISLQDQDDIDIEDCALNQIQTL